MVEGERLCVKDVVLLVCRILLHLYRFQSWKQRPSRSSTTPEVSIKRAAVDPRNHKAHCLYSSTYRASMHDVCQVSPHAVVAGAVADADAVPGEVLETRTSNRDANKFCPRPSILSAEHETPCAAALVVQPSLARPRAQSQTSTYLASSTDDVNCGSTPLFQQNNSVLQETSCPRCDVARLWPGSRSVCDERV